MRLDTQADLNLGVVGNCAIAALIDSSARVVWWCTPRFDGDPVFNGLLQGSDLSGGNADGLFEIQLEDMETSRQHYVSNTAILKTELIDSHGNAVEITDFAPRFKQQGRSFRPSTIIRQVKIVSGRPRIRVRVRPLFNYGAMAPVRTRGSNHIRYGGSVNAIRLTTDCPLSYVLEETWIYLEQPMTFWLSDDEPLSCPVEATAQEFLYQTERYWREWVRTLAIPFEWQEEVIRAAITLKLCWFEETGAIVAALTTSIPEAPNTRRTWDYRYCWLRDSFYVIQALNRLGAIDIMESYLAYLRNLPDVVTGRHVQPVYGIALNPQLRESEVLSLRGYRSMGPVRVGNQAYEHIQNDVYGQIILSAAQAFFDQRLLSPMTKEHFSQLEHIGERAFLIHNKEDASLWELRTQSRVHTYSVAMCWAACDRLSKIAVKWNLNDRVRYWRKKADHIQTFINSRFWDEAKHTYTNCDGCYEADASLLQLVELGVVPADSRFNDTIHYIEKRLLRGGHVFRYDAPDDFGVPQTAFNICSFWYIDALYRVNRHEDARAAYEKILTARNHVGLLSEGIDIGTGELWGNYPQTYSQVGIINSAMRLSQTWRDAL